MRVAKVASSIKRCLELVQLHTDNDNFNFQFSIFNFQFTNSRRSEGGIAPVSGTGDRGFESRRFDQRIRIVFYGSPFSYFRGTRTKVLRRLASIVVARRSFLSPSSPCFARARRRKQLSTVSNSLTRHFDQKDKVISHG